MFADTWIASTLGPLLTVPVARFLIIYHSFLCEFVWPPCWHTFGSIWNLVIISPECTIVSLGSSGFPLEEAAKENCSCCGIVAIKEGPVLGVILFIFSYLFLRWVLATYVF